MLVSKEYFHQGLARIEKQLAKNSTFHNSNKGGEKAKFFHDYGLCSWYRIPLYTRKKHSASNCQACGNTTTSDMAEDIAKLTQTGMKELNLALKENNLKIVKTTKRKPVKRLKQQNQMIIIKTIRQNLKPKEEVNQVLTSGTSYANYQRQRLVTYFETQEKSKILTDDRKDREEKGEIKIKSSIANFENYTFDREGFLSYILTQTGNVNWQKIATQLYPVTNKDGNFPSNRGFILKEFAKQSGVDVNSFNEDVLVSGRDFPARVRR